MPKFTLEMSAQLDNIASLQTPEDYPWRLQFGCGNCGEKTAKPLVVMSSDLVEGIRGAQVNLKYTCRLCDRVNDIKLLEENIQYEAETAPEWAPILRLECRGTEPLAVEMSDTVPLEIIGVSGFSFEDSILDDGEFYGYDEKEKTEASITEFQTRIVKG